MNLAIKYRPRNLSEILGHEKIINELKKRSKDFDFPNVVLFSGDTGTGKTTLELVIAKNILCNDKDENGNCCNKCGICNSINNDIPNNYCYIFNASNLGIDDMRIIENIAISKVFSKAKSKVIIIDELQELGSNKRAQKNILKLLEKPLKNTYFILGSMDEFKVHKSILNRTIKYRLDNLTEQQIGNCLINICKKEGIDNNSPKAIQTLLTVTNNSQGSMRTAISYLERIIYSDLWESEDLFNELGIVSTDKINSIINDIMSGDVSVLKNKITKEVLDKISEVLLLYYKVSCGYELEVWKKSYLSGLNKFDIENVKFAINKLFELSKYLYLEFSIIEFAIIEIIDHCKPKKRRMPNG